MKLILLLALHGAHASHKATKNAVDAETTQSLIEAAGEGARSRTCGQLPAQA